LRFKKIIAAGRFFADIILANQKTASVFSEPRFPENPVLTKKSFGATAAL